MSEPSSSWQQHPGAKAEAAAGSRSRYSAEHLRAPGVRFVPSDQELIVNYLRPKIHGLELPTDLVQEADVYLEHPGVLTSKLGSSVEDFWYVFSKRSRKYPNGKRPSRNTGTDGRWKAVGKNVPVLLGADKDADGKAKAKTPPEVIGHKCALAYELFVRDESSPSSRPQTAKTEWKMCEFVSYNTDKPISSAPDNMLLNNYVLCRITRKAAAAEAPIPAHQLATIVEEPDEDEQLQSTTPPDASSEQARAMVDMPHLLDDDIIEDGEEGTEVVVQTEGVDGDLEPPQIEGVDGDGDGGGGAMDVQFVDWEYHPGPWGHGYGGDFDHEEWDVAVNQFGATADLDADPMVSRFEVPVDPDSAVSPIELLTGPQPWEIASNLLFADDCHDELVKDETVKANDGAVEANATSTNKTAAPADADSPE